jgi:hypothetical protein
MTRLFVSTFIFLFIFCEPLFAVGHFEVKLKDTVIFNSMTAPEKRIRLERATLSELDLMTVSYLENNTIPDGDYELRLQSPNKENEVIFANDVSNFVFHMSWVLQRQFIGKLISVSLICKKDPSGATRELNVPIFDLELY